MTYKNALKDLLNNLSLLENDNGNLTDDKKAYYKGMIMGIVAYARYRGWTYEDALRDVARNLPPKNECVALDYFLPKSWAEDIERIEHGS